MFEALIIACAMNAGVINEDSCLMIEDELGPHITISLCEERLDEMLYFFTETEIFYYFVIMLGYPEEIGFKGYCEGDGELT